MQATKDLVDSVQRRVPVKLGKTVSDILFDISGKYPEVLTALLEYVQNAIDAGAKRVDVRVNTIDKKFTVTDNGIGFSEAGMVNTLSSIGKSVKVLDVTKLGRWGLGMLACLDLCREYRVTSIPSLRTRGYLTWIFNQEEIRNMGNEVSIPVSAAPEYVFSKERTGRQNHVTWRTRVEVIDYTNDKTLSTFTFEDIEREIRGRYSQAMIKNGTEVWLRFKDGKGEKESRILPAVFNGYHYPQFKGSTPESGVVTIDLYHRQKGDGPLTIGERDGLFLFPFSYFGNGTRTQFPGISRKAVEALMSGVFTGYIRADKVQLKPERNSFEKTDAVLGVLRVLDEWYQKVGAALMSERADSERNARYQRAATTALSRFESVIGDFEGGALMFVQRFEFGSEGAEHTKTGNGIVGAETAKRVKSPNLKGEGEVDAKTPRTSSGISKPNPSDVPRVVSDPDGRRRILVKGSSQGLGIECAPVEDDYCVFRMDWARGMMTFNTMHEYFRMVEGVEAHLVDYQMMILAYVFGARDQLESEAFHTDPEFVKLFDDALVRTLRYFVPMIGKR